MNGRGDSAGGGVTSFVTGGGITAARGWIISASGRRSIGEIGITLEDSADCVRIVGKCDNCEGSNGTGESRLLSGTRGLDLLLGTGNGCVVMKSVWIVGNTASQLCSPNVTYPTVRY